MQVPFLSNRASAQPFRRVIQRTADRFALSDFTVALIASHFFEGIIREVASGRAVTIPMLGMFAPIRWKSPVGKFPAHATPRFSASRAFRTEVANSCSPNPDAQKLFENYRKNHNRSGNPESKVPRRNSTGFTASLAFRQQIEAQARRIGLDPYDCGS